MDWQTFVTHLECSQTGERYEADVVQGLSRTGKPLLVRYDLASLAAAVSKDQLKERPAEFWRYHESLPVRRPENVVSLGEVTTPLLRAARLQRELGVLGMETASLALTGWRKFERFDLKKDKKSETPVDREKLWQKLFAI